jgi:hypothetical protein
VTAAVVSGGSRGRAARRVATKTAPVTRRDIVNRERVSGTLGYADVDRALVARRSGVVTALAPEGTVVERGQALYAVDGSSVPLLVGDVPMWRDLAVGVAGPDVRQLNDNLVALGFGDARSLGSNDVFNEATAGAMRKLQAALHADETGMVRDGEVVFLPAAVRVGEHKLMVGSAVQQGTEITAVSSASRVVNVDLDAAKQSRVKVGDDVQVEVPNGASLAGKVATVAKVAKAADGDKGGGSGGGGAGGSGSDSSTVKVTITLTDAGPAGDVDQAPVKVAITTARARNVLAVPVRALLALAEGGYGVEVVGTMGRRLVGVQTGLFNDGDDLVEVTSDRLKEGDRVAVAG